MSVIVVLAHFQLAWMRWKTASLRKELARGEARVRELQANEDDNFIRLLGYATRGWAHVEYYLDLTNFHVVLTPEGSLLAKELPRSLNPKIDLYKKAHRHLSALSPVLDDGIALASRVTSLKHRRHDLIHGVIRTVDAPASRPRHVTRLVLSGQSVEFVERQFSMDDLIALVVEMHSLSDDLFAHLGRAIELLGTTKEAEQPLRQFAVGAASPILPKSD